MRLKFFKRSWFDDKEILDIGCNIGEDQESDISSLSNEELYPPGHITFNIAKYNNPTRIVGLDIDKKLIEIARKNIRHYLDKR